MDARLVASLVDRYERERVELTEKERIPHLSARLVAEKFSFPIQPGNSCRWSVFPFGQNLPL